MSNKTINIPLGSQHISLLEPVRFKFECENEKIIGVDSDVGFVHRGIEKACTTKFKFDSIGYVVARVCGLCAITHSLSYSVAIEKLIGAEVSKKAKYLRILLLELDRIHSHMLCLSHTCENAGFEAMFMRMMGDRELIMEIQELLTGNRVQFDFISIGGVNRDLDAQMAKQITEKLKIVKEKVLSYIDEFTNNWSLSLKFKGIGTLTLDEAYRFNAIGPLARASGLNIDVRNEIDYLPYNEIGFKMQTHSDGDINARNIVRLNELLNSIEMCNNIIEGLPEGEIFTKAKGKPNGESIVRFEAPRGELMYYVKGNGKAILERVRIKTPTFACIPAFSHIFVGQDYADAPAILASFDPCLSCTAK
ncbi:nickel-dependent hydrogenase large subunit [Candidatus Sulfurimonas marisnigri]|uniref:Nickel-dependent hydrogenase large subunit n=1 Tax=Candidatus Sulfurimonas marisnigri TaxID=2740405 RepID=A0A7S7RNZ7_9BACT|nr:nickel-dependent hydrogenase large subunit [Candidatus Sulfurimonas marisnigri]QOY53832.1 nickel-dependent hydrogenase large subunit [Candidatus Sulfurimonas marisnigri]